MLFLAIAVALTYPLVRSLAATIPNDPGDPLLNVWLLSWNAHRVPFSPDWWNGPFFHPVSGTLAFSEHLVGVGGLSSPLLWLGFDPVTAHNLAFLLSFPMCALSAYLLCRSLTGRNDVALVGGLAFGFAPYRIAQVSHLDLLSSYWMPLTLLGLHRYARQRRTGWLVLFAVSWLMQVLCKGYSLFHFSVLIVLWVLWFAPPWREWRTAGRIALAWALAALPLVPVLLQYRAVHERYGLRRDLRQIEAFSADVASLADGSPLLAHWRSLFGGDQETWLFPGLATIAVVVLAMLWGLRQRPPEDQRKRALRLVLAALAAVAALAALSVAAVGPWRIDWGPLKLSVTAAHKPLALAWVFLIAALVTAPRFVDALRRRSCFVFYVSATLALWVLSLGPTPRAFGALIWDKAPHWWLLQLPGFSSLRVPARFWINAVLCLSVAASIGLAFLVARLRRPWRGLLVAAAALAVLRDGWITALPLVSPPARSPVLEGLGPGPEAVLELPVGGLDDAAALYRSIFHRRPVVNGFSGYEPPHYFALRAGLERRDHGVLTALSAHDALYVAVVRERDAGGGWDRWISAAPGARPVGTSAVHTVYLVPPAGPSPPASGTSRRLTVQAIHASVDGPGAGRLLDGDLRSRWTTGAPQRGSEKIVVDLGSAERIGTVVLLLGRFVADFPRELIVEVSADGEGWTEAWRGPTAGPTLSGCLADPLRAPLALQLGGRAGRFLRLRQVGEDPVYSWSAVEIEVHGPSAAGAGGAGVSPP